MHNYKNPGYVTLKSKFKRFIWNLAYIMVFRPFGLPIFRLWRIAVLRLFGAEVKWDANVYASAVIWAPWLLKIDSRACIGPHVICYNQDVIELKSNAVVSQYSFLCTASHDTQMVNTAKTSLITAPISIDDYAWVAARSFVGPGVHIGEYAVVGATASVYKDVPPWTVVGGNPAKPIKKRVIRDADN